ncbi:hydrolase 2, exosortase A system-associated [Thauera sp. 63]|uniref:hydrolase 2, exosortase A system-associated n=1 Tax=Thauera sp. 63 TaxID=497321 RepID=UPI0009FA117D|nr:hydrolase 2, exosortase A system-associated [Thauera sp. 63]
MPPTQREAFFLSRPGGGQCFCIVTGPGASQSRGAVLYVHPFAEELNKSRRMAALAAAALAQKGWTVLQIDLLGCGDSSGDFEDAAWDAWLADIGLAYGWLEAQGFLSVALWGLRAGGLLASDWLSKAGKTCPVLVWQPVVNGKQHLQQFLRLKGVSGMLDEHDAKAVMAAMRAEIERGSVVEVAGYRLAPSLVAGLEAARLDFPDEYAAPVRFLELNPAVDAPCSPAILTLARRLTARGADVRTTCVTGPSFWQAQEIEVSEGLLCSTSLAMDEMHGGR